MDKKDMTTGCTAPEGSETGQYLRCWAEVSLAAIRHNAEEIRKKLEPGMQLMAVVKADAYGHGDLAVAGCLHDLADAFAVATPEEGIRLRRAGINKPVLILGYTSPAEAASVVRHDLEPAVWSMETARAVSDAAAAQGAAARIHIALDTGMTRIGLRVNEAGADAILQIAALPHLEIRGIFSHYSCADMTDKSYCRKQEAEFDTMLTMLSERGLSVPLPHLCNSAGIMEFDRHRGGMARAGIILYGIYPSEEVDKTRLDLIPALSWHTRVIHVADVEPGRGVSYGATYTTERPVTRIATVSAGYADGYPRALSGRGHVLIRGRFAPILGRVCMDQMMVDVSDIPDVRVEDVVTLIGKDGTAVLPVEEVADPASRFNYEMLCSISPRVTRVYTE